MIRRRAGSLPSRRAGAFTLIELILVITIIGILGTIVVVKVTPLLWMSKKTKAGYDLQKIVSAAEMLHVATGEWPVTIPAMVNPRARDGTPLVGLKEVPRDPWKNDYVYELEDDGPRAICLGRDGREGGTGEDEDLVWPGKEGS